MIIKTAHNIGDKVFINIEFHGTPCDCYDAEGDPALGCTICRGYGSYIWTIPAEVTIAGMLIRGAGYSYFYYGEGFCPEPAGYFQESDIIPINNSR